MDVDSLRQLGAIVLVLGLLVVALWALRRAGWFTAGISGGISGGILSPQGFGAAVRGLTSRARALESVERLPLTPQHSLHLVRIAGRELLVGTHPQGCVLLVDLPVTDLPVDRDRRPAGSPLLEPRVPASPTGESSHALGEIRA